MLRFIAAIVGGVLGLLVVFGAMCNMIADMMTKIFKMYFMARKDFVDHLTMRAKETAEDHAGAVNAELNKRFN